MQNKRGPSPLICRCRVIQQGLDIEPIFHNNARHVPARANWKRLRAHADSKQGRCSRGGEPYRGIFRASLDARAEAVRALFVEVLDFDAAFGRVDLGAAASAVGLPASVERVAHSGGVHVVFLAMDAAASDRVRKAELAAAAKSVAEQLGGDLLLVVSNPSSNQLHLVYPSFEGVRPVLRRMVIERDLPRRTAIQQVSNIFWKRQDTGSIQRALDEAFDVEPVTREFFREYKRVFEEATQRVSGLGDQPETKRRFVQTLFNRLMFIYFLSRKGWLTFKGDKDYLNALWHDYLSTTGDDKNFHTDRLQVLFFGGLNNILSQDASSHRLGMR